MVDKTPRLGLNTYDQTDTTWDHTDTVTAVDEYAIEHGPIAERPDQGTYDDELYHATDQGITWRWNASSEDWEYFSGQGSENRPVPGTTHIESASIDHLDLEGGSLTDPAGVTHIGTLGSGSGDGIHGQLRDGNLVAVGDSVSTMVDPETTSTPVQDAIDACEAAGGGAVYLPPTTIESPGKILISKDNVSLYGFWGKTTIQINAANTDGLIYDRSGGGYVTHSNIDGITIQNTAAGRNHDVSTGRAIVDHGRWRCHVGQLRLRHWNGNVWEDLYSTFGCTHDYIVFDECDAGSADAFMYFEEYAEPNHFTLVEGMCTDAYSGTCSDLLHSADGANLTIGTLRGLDPTPGHLATGTWNCLTIQNGSWEPAIDNAPVPNQLFDLKGRNVHIGRLQVNPSGAVDQLSQIYRTWTVEDSYFSNPRIDQDPRGQLAVDESSIVLLRGSGNTDRPIIFEGHDGQVTDNTGDGAYAPLGDLQPGLGS